MNEFRDTMSESERRSRLGTVDSWIWLLAGGTLAAAGLARAISKRSAVGGALAAGGGLMVYNGLRTRSHITGVHVQRAVTIQRSPEELYREWRNFENLPRFMRHLESVKQLDGRRSHWVARGPMGARFEWDGEIIDERENQWLAWRSMPDSPLEMRGSVEFRRAPGDRGTEVIVAIHYEPVRMGVGQFLSSLLGAVPERVLLEEIRTFKQLMEAGEIPTTDGQPSGRRGAVVSMMNRITSQQPATGERTA